MSPAYVPILKAKAGEFSALQNLPARVAARIVPLFDLPRPDQKYEGTVQDHISKVARNCGVAWSGKAAYVDITKWRPNERVESGVHVLSYALARLAAAGVLVRPVVGYDRWDDVEYSQALRSASALFAEGFCLRLDVEAIEDMGDADYFEERIDEISSALGLSPENCHVIVDFADLTKASVPEILEKADLAVDYLKQLGFRQIIVAGGSMPAFVNEAVDEPDQIGMIHRIEMLVWKAMQRVRNDPSIIYGDYGIRNPAAMDGIISKHNNGKIRYTVANQFFILRGHSKQIERIGVQQKALSRQLLGSSYYMGPAFSWGDRTVTIAANPADPYMGGPTQWIGIDTNHHIHAVLAEVFEHQTQLATLPF
ncbi:MULTISPECIES: beta family protein [Burkholderia cepacia complex]|uniref:beta family protein n=1 Tax=Burkholderia cepacia complex TaxID=87882 RepID=UPI0007C86DBE|nr:MULTISPECIES: beta family protein [Burkholderia cepacia complex]